MTQPRLGSEATGLVVHHGVARRLVLPQRIELLIERIVPCFILSPPTGTVYRIVERSRDGIVFEAPGFISAIGGIGRGSVGLKRLDGGDTEITFSLSFHETWEVLLLAAALLTALGTLTVISAWSTLAMPFFFLLLTFVIGLGGPALLYRTIVRRKVRHFEAFFRNLQYLH